MTDTMRIGEVARRLDLNPRTIRYYEEIGLLPEPERTEGGFRTYTPDEVERIDFIRLARSLDLPLDEIREILSFRDHGEAPCPYVLRLLEAKIKEVERKIASLRALRQELRTLRAEAAALPPKVLAAKGCVCHIIENRRLEAEQ